MACHEPGFIDHPFRGYEDVLRFLAGREGLPQDRSALFQIAADSHLERSYWPPIGELVVVRLDYRGDSRFGIRGAQGQGRYYAFQVDGTEWTLVGIFHANHLKWESLGGQVRVVTHWHTSAYDEFPNGPAYIWNGTYFEGEPQTVDAPETSGRQTAEYYHVMELDLQFDEPIADLDQWVADNFADEPNASVDFHKPERFELDLDHDGTPEVFLTSTRLHGTGGGPHLVFQRRGDEFRYAGQLPGRRHTIRVLPVGPDGHARVRTWWSGGAGYGIATLWKWDGRGFTQLSSEDIQAGDSGTEEGNRRFEELFGELEIQEDALPDAGLNLVEPGQP